MKLENAYKVDTETSIKTLRKQEGFTLLEVLIAVTIFAVGLLAIAAMQTSAIRMNSTGGQLTELSTLGIDKFEELMSLPFTNSMMDVDEHTDLDAPDGYSVTWSVAQDSLVTDTRRITVTVTGKGKELKLFSIRCKSL